MSLRISTAALGMDAKTLRQRIKGLFESDSSLDKILLVNLTSKSSDPNFFYMTGFTSGMFETTFAVISRQGMKILTSKLEYETAKEQLVKGMSVVEIKSGEHIDELLRKELSGKAVGLNTDVVPYSVYEKIRKAGKPKRIADVSETFARLRMIKDGGEMQLIRKAAAITKLAMDEISHAFREGMTEIELAGRFDNVSAVLGSAGPSFKTIVCFGKNAALPHHAPDRTKLRKGDFILIDAGATVNNYCSDISRTFIFDKKTAPHQKKADEMLALVKKAQKAAIAAIKPGVDGRSIHNIAEDVISSAHKGMYKGTFIHALGHSLGIEVHDGTGFTPRTSLILKPGMVITVEPGVYVPGFGGVRFEDDIVVTENGALIL